jgi:hypothetical protein
MYSLDALYDEWAEFAKKTFPGNPIGKAQHIYSEAQELEVEVEANGMTDHAFEELADIFLIMIHLSDSQGKEKFRQAIRDKMDKNFRRVWNPPDKNGMVVHVKGIED